MPCRPKTYRGVDSSEMEIILNELKNNGAEISGNNPWTVKTNQMDIVLKGTHTDNANKLTIEILDKPFLIPCSTVWNAIDELIDDLI